MEERWGERTSRGPILVGLTAVSGFAVACMIVLWLFTREPPRPERSERVTSPLPVEQVAVPGAGPARASPQPLPDPQPLPASQPPAAPAPEPSLFVTPLFDTGARFEQRKPATLRFMAQRGAPAVLATGAELSVSVLLLPDGKAAQLPVREVGEGVYEADFVPGEPGQFALAVASRGKPARTAGPVTLGVVGPVAETGAAVADDGGQAGAGGGASRSRGALGGAVSHRGR